MSVLWCGGEDIDFPNGASASVSTSSSTFRTGYARCSIVTASGILKSTLFPGGAITSAWLSCRIFAQSGQSATNVAGFGASGTASGLFISVQAGSSTVSITLQNGGTLTTLVTSLASFSLNGVHRYDLQLVSYGASSTVTLYVDGVQACTFSGSTSITGVSGFDSVFIASSNPNFGVSEIIGADESTLGWQGLVTMAPNANGTTQQWSNPADTNFNPTTINDANATFTNTTAQDEQAGIIALPSGSFAVKMVKTVARALATSGAASTNLKVGFRNASGTVAVASSHALTSAFLPYEDYFTTDPTTSAAWGTLASYQLDLRSA